MNGLVFTKVVGLGVVCGRVVGQGDDEFTTEL